jgi:hypothetical protein
MEVLTDSEGWILIGKLLFDFVFDILDKIFSFS